MSTGASRPAVLPELEQMLSATAARHVRRSSGPRRIAVGRIPRLVAVTVACVALGGTALAATGVWNPIVGDPENPATLSGTPVPAALVAELGVLRREQTPQDRSPEVEATLEGADVPQGVRLESVRYLGPGADGEATVMLSGVEAGPFDPEGDPVCVARPLPGATHSVFLCFGLSTLLGGTAWGEALGPTGEFAYGVVPDDVATVTAEFDGPPPHTVPVHDNYWELPLSGAESANPHGESGVQHTVWRDAEGNVVPQRP